MYPVRPFGSTYTANSLHFYIYFFVWGGHSEILQLLCGSSLIQLSFMVTMLIENKTTLGYIIGV